MKLYHPNSHAFFFNMNTGYRPIIYESHPAMCAYLQHMTALHESARSRKLLLTSKDSAYFRVWPSMMRATSFSLPSKFPSSVQCCVMAALVAWNESGVGRGTFLCVEYIENCLKNFKTFLKNRNQKFLEMRICPFSCKTYKQSSSWYTYTLKFHWTAF